MVDEMFLGNEISEPVSKYLKGGGKNLPKFYHLLKTHKIPSDVDKPEEWIEENGYPLRGIIAGQGGPLERLGASIFNSRHKAHTPDNKMHQ